MPDLAVNSLPHKAVLLGSLAYNRYGRLTIEDVPVEVPCRWVPGVTMATSGTTDVESITAQVIVDRLIYLGSIMWLGRASEFPRDWPNDNPSELSEVIGYHEVDSQDGHSVSRWVDVARYKDQLAQVG